MPLLKTYTRAEVEAAIARSNGIALGDIGATDNSNRTIAHQGASPYRAGTGHVFAHVATYTQRLSGDAGLAAIRSRQNAKSLWQNRHDAIGACLDMLNNASAVRKMLGKFDNSVQRAKYSSPVDVKGNVLTGDFYGYPAGGTALMKVVQGAINIWEVGGSLVIFSAYPTSFVAFEEPGYNLDQLFSNDAFADAATN